ncbi:E3 ubiquitin-protein ligase rnf213-alpha-like [Glandiceps talaboti]
MVRQLVEHWIRYQVDQTMMTEQNVRHLSLDFLGLLLETLVKEEHDHQSVSGEPLMIPCDKVEKGKICIFRVQQENVLKACMTLYFSDKKVQRPESGDVLICSEDTTKEEVDLFWRRAVKGSYGIGRLFCLLRPELLPNHIMQYSTDCFNSHCQGRFDYYVAIICSEGSDKWIATSFDDESMDVRTLDCLSDEQLTEYLCEFLQPSGKRHKSSSVNDPDRFGIKAITSSFPGNGKSLLVAALQDQLVKKGKAENAMVKIPVHTTSMKCRDIASRLIDSQNSGEKRSELARIYHIDISSSVKSGIDEFIFNLAILKQLSDDKGRIWRRRTMDVYFIEATIMRFKNRSGTDQSKSLLEILPKTFCLSPSQTLNYIKRNPSERNNPEIHALDDEVFSSKPFQHVYFYLKDFKEMTTYATSAGLPKVDVKFSEKIKNVFKKKGKLPTHKDTAKCLKKISINNRQTCLELLLEHIRVQNPTWAVLHQFVRFFDFQLSQWEKSPFCDDSLSDDLPDLRIFVLKFILIISQDFATPSLNISDRSFVDDARREEELVDMYKRRRTWEKSPHPYVFFNEDGSSLTFHGFLVREDGSLSSTADRELNILGISMSFPLRNALLTNGVELSVDFDTLKRHEQVQRMQRVLNLQCVEDPDPSYELTTDCVTKMLAILMRFRCSIPVVIMGETGCGKTRLIRYLCEMMKGPDCPRNFFLMKVHGGTTFNDIEKKVELAEEKALENGDGVYTILFFDEANTTEAVSLIKEVMLDRSVNGRPLKTKSLKFVAACNPYRMLPEKAIKNLEAAGLGFRVRNAVDSREKLGNIPLRHLVYRVHQLPPSLLACVWDFGQLSLKLEESYIRSMVKHGLKNPSVKLTEADNALIIKVLVASHDYMRRQEEECRFVTLRDIERVINVFTWLYVNYDLYGNAMDEQFQCKKRTSVEGSGAGLLHRFEGYISSHITNDTLKVKRCIILTAGICYHSSLKNRLGYRKYIARCFTSPYTLNGEGEKAIEEEISRCQDVFLDGIKLNPNIARNEALKENVFMIIVCLELRIPIFLVGKPGSSKSLAKTIVDNDMKGLASSSKLLKNLKSVQMWSCQCSQHSTAETIIETFNLCANFQRKQQLDKKLGVVVLDEVGLAEDTPSLPLKTLHPLLENGCIEDTDTPAAWKKVGFIGMSNWALDPAKMNRGIFVVRDVPSISEIENTAREIASADDMKQLIKPLSVAYLDLFRQCSEEREYYGLRDFYGLIKLLSAVCKTQGRKPTWQELKHCVFRNFDGHQTLNAIDYFHVHCKVLCTAPKEDGKQEQEEIYHCSSLNLVRANLNSVGSSGETRYLMLMTNHSAAHDVIWHLKDYVGKPLLNAEKTLVIFGSQYQRDQGYTQVCRNIKRIKLCMETGQTVVLINADNLYESLYDTMNQYYFEYGDLRYVNLGLGTNRFNSRVSKDFRLIIIAERDIVMKNYPIPLINRLEKHFLTFDDLLTTSEHNMVDEMKEWVKSFVAFDQTKLGLGSRMDYKCNPENAFIGLGDDTIAMIVHQLSIQKDRPSEQDIRNATRAVLLQYCTPDAVARLSLTPLGDIAQTIREEYFDKQRHSSLTCFLDEVISSHPEKGILAQVTTHGKLLNVNRDLANLPNSYHGIIDVLNLQQFTSEQEIRDVLQDFYSNGDGEKRTLVFQLAADLNNFKLIPFIRYLIQDEWRTSPTCNRHVVLVLHFSRIGENVPLNIPISPWLSIHIDELRQPTIDAPQVERVAFKALSDILSYNEGDAVNATAILKMCIQSAVGKIETRYKIESPASHNLSKKDLSKEELVGVLQDLLGDDSHMESTSFPKVVTKRLCLLLKEKEKSLVNNGANWARNEVFSAGSLIAGGTLRRTLILKLCSEITPLFAELISYMNLHNGIQQLKKFKGEHSCLYLLWLSLFEDDSMTRINLDSSIKHSLSVMGPGPSVHKNNIEWKFPFSWVIFEAINEVIDSAESLQYGDQCERLGLRYWKILESGSIGRTIVKPLEKLDCDWNEVLTTYLHDFIHMVYKSEHKVGYKLASQFILKTAKKTLPSFRGQEEERHHINFVDIHLAYRNVKGRLGNLNRLINNMPETCDKLDSSEQDEDMDLDLVILHNCLQNLIPTKDQLKDVSFREKWLNDLPNIGAVAQHICVGNGHLAYNSECQTLINACRIKWNAIAMIRLYMEHLSPPDEECKESVVKYAYAFFQSLLNEKEVSKLSHFKKVEKLLKTCNSSIVKRYFGGQACMAGTHQLAATFVLISGKPYCRKCFKADPSVSPENPTDNETFHNSVQDYKLYLQKCSVFLLELVSSFYLKTDGIESVDDEMIERLFAYIAIEGILFKPKTSSSDVCIDTSPVVRSYLLQLLLSCGKEKIEQCLQAHLNECLMVDLGVADDTLGAHESLMELVVLYAQCIEDTLVNTDEIFERMQDAWERIEACTEQQYLVASSDSRTVRIQDIHDVAIVRSGLRRLAEVIHIDFERGNITKDHSHVVALFTAKSIISRSKSTHMSSFLLKQICRRYSLDYLVKIKEHEVMNWIIPEMLMDKEEATNFDQFAIHGKCYSEIKKTLTSIRDGEETTSDLVDMLQRFTVTHGKGHLQVCFLLALFHKNTIGFEDMERKAMVIKELKDDVIKFDILGNSTNYFFKFLDGVLNIQQPQGRFFLLPTQRKAVDRWMTSLLVHFCAVMSVAGNRRPLEPLFQLIHFPDRFKNSYLPSMPDDDFQILKCAFREDEGRWYFCPNGHPYFIGECGKPWIQSTCQCGAKIGGEMHHLRKDNTQSQNEEQPTKGHILGKPEQREDEVPISCRKVGPVSFAVLRFITHAAMFLGCMSTQDIANLIHLRHKSHISEGEVVDFLIQHMKRDVQLLAKAIGHSEEEANLTLHVVLCSMMTPPSDQPGSNYSITLQSKEDRSVWEHVFANCYIGRAIENLENKLEDISLLMAEDAELENELVTVALFEKDRPPKTILQPLFMTPFLWRYQSRPSLKHLKGILQGRQEQNDEVTYPVLTEFMRSEHKLSVLRYLPDIIDLQLLLKRSLHLRIARNDTSMDVNANTQICTFLDQYGDQHLRRLVGSLSRAWEKLKQPMMEEGLTGLQIQDSDLYSDCDLLEMPLSAILPTIDGNGVSLSLGVVEALVTIQNQFLVLSTVSQVVKLTDVAKAHLIAFDPEEDLEPLVVTHCDYSLEMGRGTCLDYNFEGLERQIITKFVQGKSRVQREVILFTYADSICDKIVFERLRRLIPQTEILPQVENEIITEFRERLSLPDLHTALRSLDLAIAILNSSGGNPGQLIQEYLTEALRLRENDGLMSEKARKNCTLSNLLSLWQICEIEKTKQLIDGGLDPFDDIQPGFKHEIPHALKTVLERHTLKQFRIDTMENMLKLLYEFITLELKVGVHTEVIQYEPLRFRIDSLCSEDIHGIECISDEVLLTHVVDFWKSVNKYLSKQKKQKSTY